MSDILLKLKHLFIKIFEKLSNFLGWVIKYWKRIALLFLFILFFYPSVYPFTVKLVFPHSYYYVGALGNPAKEFNSRVSWNIDMNWIDRSPPDEQWNRLATAQGQIARVKGHGIPGRSSPSGISNEIPGKIWTEKQCLFINDIKFVLLDVDGVDINSDGKSSKREIKETAQGIEISGADLIALYGREAPGDKFRDKLLHLENLGIQDGICPEEGFGKRCSRVAIWAYGAPAPCSIWPF